ncbi:MAG: ShlB/FhaC/HecB family hemolysin secretion/activation protein [Burkholderiales bacterium]
MNRLDRLLRAALHGAAMLSATTVCAFAQPAPAPAERPRFDVLEFTVEGNSVLPAAAIEAAVYPFMGEGRTIDDVENARRALEEAYRKAGFLSVGVDVPEQKVDAGVVRLQVTEGRVNRLRVRENRWFSAGTITSRLPSVAEGTVPDFNAFQAELAKVIGPDRSLSPSLKAGRLPGTLDIDLIADDKLPLHGSVDLNNFHNAGAPPLRLGASLRYDDLFDLQHSISAQLLVTPADPKQLRVGSFTYAMPVNDRRDTLAFYALESRSESLSGSGVGLSTVFGNQRVFGLRLARPLGLSAGLAHVLTVGIDHKRTGLDVSGASNDESPVNYTPLMANWNASRSDKGETRRYDATLLMSVRGLGNDPDQFARRRYNGDASFAVLRLDATVEQPLAGDWRLKARAVAQLAGRPLLAYEQFALGGALTGRAYYESEFLGDYGASASLEVQAPRWSVPGDRGELRPLIFADLGRAQVVDPLPEQRDRMVLASAGAGLRLTLKPRLSMSIDAGRALRDGTTTRTGDWRVTARFAAEF